MENVLKLALENGIWAGLFCVLFLYQLRDSREREKKYTETLASLTESVKGIQSVKQDTVEIIANCKEIKAGVNEIKTATAISAYKKLNKEDADGKIKEKRNEL